MMTGHTLNVTLDSENRVVLAAVCHEPDGAPCRLACEKGCEEAFQCSKGHLKPVDYCNLVTWLDEEDDLAECYRGDYPQSLCDGMPIIITWDGDRYEWSALTDAPG